MQNTILVSVLVGALAGVGGAFLAQGLIGPTSTSPSSDSAAGLTIGGDGDAEGLSGQVATLQAKNEDLTLRLSSLEQRLNKVNREVVPTERSAEIDDLKNQIVQLAMALENPASAEAVSLRKAVGTALEDIRAAEEAEREAEQEAREIRRMDERMAKYVTDLGLDQIQAKEMRGVLDAETIKREEMFAAMRDGGGGGGGGGGDRGQMRTVMNELRTETQTALQGILNPVQYEAYQESNQGFGRGNRGGGNTGGGRGGR